MPFSEVKMTNNSDLAEPECGWNPLEIPSQAALQKFMGAVCQALSSKIMNSSNRAAVAIDKYTVKLARNLYYPYSTSRGMLRSSSPILTDLACIWTIIALYVRNIRYTSEGSFWHAESQLIAETTRSVLQQSGEL
ncbi:hypothetical protein GGR53DRAFT_526430 [Hypoxylon sp. FL1150]|nr:hypothetical protein GGR53DRAFT_526430 [Hypoxylon sp. FL1150]